MEIRTDQQGNQKPEPVKARQDFSHQKGFKETLTERLLVKNDKVSISGEKTPSEVTYSQNLAINKLENDGYDQLRGLVANLLKEQGLDLKIAVGDAEVNIEEISQEEAQALVAEDGYFGVEQTSDRIVDFAKAISGNDPSRIKAIKEGIEKGFNEALEAFGGSLPDISYQTYDAVYEKLDSWIAESSQVQE